MFHEIVFDEIMLPCLGGQVATDQLATVDSPELRFEKADDFLSKGIAGLKRLSGQIPAGDEIDAHDRPTYGSANATCPGNAAAYIAQLQGLDEWVKNQVSQLPAEKRLLVTNHDALGYFAQAYDFKIIGAVIPSVSPDVSPSAQQLTGLIDTIRKSGAPAIFLDIGENRKLADQVASETGVKVVTDLYVESTSGPNGPAPTYIDMIKYDVNKIITVLK